MDESPNPSWAPDRASAEVVHVSFYRDPLRRTAQELLKAWPTLEEVARAVGRAGINVAVVQAAHADELAEREGVRFHFVRGEEPPFLRFPPRPRVPRRPTRLLARLRELGPRLIHLQGLSFPIETRYLSRAAPATPVLAQDHASRPFRGWRRVVQRWGLDKLAAAAFTSRDQFTPFAETGVLRPNLPVYEVVEGSTWFTPGDRDAARQATRLSGDPCVLCVGHLNENKDPVTVLGAVARAAATLPELRLWMCYRSAPLLGRVRQLIATVPALQDRVTLLGEIPHIDLEAYLRAADFVVSASKFEGSGYSVIEAMACGTTPVVTDIPSFRKITDGGSVGALVPPGNEELMAAELVAWNARRGPALRARTRQHFDRHLSFDAIGGQLGDAYREILACT